MGIRVITPWWWIWISYIVISSWTTRRSCFTQLQVLYLPFTTTRGICTVRFLPSDTRTPISLETRCPLTVAWLIQKIWRSLVRWLWPEPQQTTSRSLFRTPLVVPMWMLTHRWSYSMWWASLWNPLLTSVRLYQCPTWSGLYAGIPYYLLWKKTRVLLVRG